MGILLAKCIMDSSTVNFAGRTSGGVLHLPDAIKEFPDAEYAIYNRVSTYSQAGKGLVKLHGKTAAVVQEYRNVVPPPRFPFVTYAQTELPVFEGLEEGKLSKPRKTLIAAVEHCRKQEEQMIIVASDPSRFIRAAAYHRTKNSEAVPTPEEFAMLSKITKGVVLATITNPSLTERERHSRAMARAMAVKSCGRPRKLLSYECAHHILLCLGFPRRTASGIIRWEEPLRLVARRHRVPLATVQRLLDAQVVAPSVNRKGLLLKECCNPPSAFRVAYKKGLLKQFVS